MKKKLYQHLGTLSMLSLLFLLLSFSATAQDLTDAQKQERCENNKKRLTELEGQLRAVKADLSKTMSEEEMDDTRDKRDFLIKFIRGYLGESYWKNTAAVINANWKRINVIGAEYNFSFDGCVKKAEAKFETLPELDCLNDLERLIRHKIDMAGSVNRGELLIQKADIEKQIASHRTNLIALGCDKINKNSKEEFIKKLVGGWTDKPTPWATPGGGCQIQYKNGILSLINENKDESGATISLNTDGSAIISASKWGVSGKVDKYVLSIKWSNDSEWIK